MAVKLSLVIYKEHHSVANPWKLFARNKLMRHCTLFFSLTTLAASSKIAHSLSTSQICNHPESLCDLLCCGYFSHIKSSAWVTLLCGGFHTAVSRNMCDRSKNEEFLDWLILLISEVNLEPKKFLFATLSRKKQCAWYSFCILLCVYMLSLSFN